MRRDRPALFKGRHFEAEIIILCVRRYLRYALSLRNLEEIMAERNVHVDHVTIWRWIQRYAPELSRRCRRELRRTRWLPKNDIFGQAAFIAVLFGYAGQVFHPRRLGSHLSD